ncbi:sulfatase-like hydrolase/transferase [Marinicellulosiphila megalodicopiae]|uniref:sulfatase-like hydrolase/transferase n=1 Tax=Marinicellulosiphila megalodicopiae TaxID=2724896 RepID=UPI003BAE445E
MLHKFIPFVLKVILTFIAYNSLAYLLKGIVANWQQFLMEVPLILLSTGCFYFALNKKTHFRTWVAMIPWLLFYSIVDIYYILFNRVFKLVEFLELPEMYDILPTYFTVCSLLLFGFLTWLFLKNLLLKRTGLLLAGFSPLALTAFFAYFIPAQYINVIQFISPSINTPQEYEQTSENGRWVTLLYFEAVRSHALNSLSHPENWQDERSNLKTNELLIAEHKNVHIIVLESFLDPTLLNKLPNIQTAMPDFFKKINSKKGMSISPVFGNRTPQAEFEILCNVPALQQTSIIEFNVFTGAPTSCLPAWLKQAGWKTVATHAYKPSFFNREKAYLGLQFDEIYFAKEYKPDASSYFETRLEDDIQFMYDGDLFEQNRAFVQAHINSPNKQPLFNYMLGVYGHWPNIRDKQRFPDVIELDLSEHNTEMQNIVNEYYYRMVALETHIQQLHIIDPNSLILVISDHLPPMKGMSDVYAELDYLPSHNNNTFVNIFYLFNDSNIVETQDVFHHYQMADLIISHLTQSKCLKPECLPKRDKTNLSEHYKHVISSALQ